MNTQKKDNGQSSADLLDSNGSNYELFSQEDIKNSPFVVVTDNEKGVSFGVMGKYRITEDYNNAKDVKKELNKMNWNRIIQVMMLLIGDKEFNNLIEKL